MKLDAVRNAILNRIQVTYTDPAEHALADPSALTHEFLASMYAHLRAHVKDGELSESDFQAAVRHARAHAGGKRRGMNAAQAAAMQAEMSELTAELCDMPGMMDDDETPRLDPTAAAVNYQNEASDAAQACIGCRFFDEPFGCYLVAGNIRPLGTCDLFEAPFAEPIMTSVLMAEETTVSTEIQLHEFAWGVEFGEGAPIQIMRTGTFQHPEYGEFSITPRDIQEIAANFRRNTRGQDIPVDIDHNHSGGAVGWMKGLTIKDAGNRLDAVVDWTDEGEQLVGGGKFKYFSPHFGPWEDPETGEQHRVVLMSGAITNFPFLKHMEPLALSEFAVRQKEDRPMAMELAEMQKALEETQRKLSEAETARTQQEKELADARAAQDKVLTEAAEREKALTDRIGLIERDARVKRLSDLVHGNGNPNARWIGQQDDQVTFLMSLAETFGEDSPQFKHYVGEQNANAARIRESGLFTEVGSSGGGAPATVQGEVDLKLAEIMAGGKTRPEALIELMRSDSALYSRLNAETISRAK